MMRRAINEKPVTVALILVGLWMASAPAAAQVSELSWFTTAGGAAAVAEPFSIREETEPGMVVIIDTEHPGQLCLVRAAYNRLVAGVVSRAGDLPTGAILGNVPGKENAPSIALSGRDHRQGHDAAGSGTDWLGTRARRRAVVGWRLES